MTLNDLHVKQPAVVSRVHHDDTGHWRKLVALGIAPGVSLTITQKWPAYVVRIGHTELALDMATARLIHVEPSAE